MRGKIAASVLILLAILSGPAAAFAFPGTPAAAADNKIVSPVTPAAAAISGARDIHAATPTGTVRPRVTLENQNRSPLLSAIAERLGEHPRLTATVFLSALVIIIIVLGIAAFLITRRKNSAAAGAKKQVPPDRDGGRPTFIGDPAEPPAPSPTGPAALFPLSLGNLFGNPEFIGEGGAARVFRARNAKTGNLVAVKVPVRFDEATGIHFTRDIFLWQGLEHKNIIRILSSNILPIPYIEMEYAPSSLAKILLPLPEERAIAVVLDVARGLEYAHGKGIVHRDIKPENILLAGDGTAKITDWGLGKAMGNSLTTSVIGFSPAYAAPEQLAPQQYGRPGPATDIYQLGILLAETLTGSVVFHGKGAHDMNMAILSDHPVIPSWNGRHEPHLRQIILRCLARKPEDRYPTVSEFIKDLESVQAA